MRLPQQGETNPGFAVFGIAQSNFPATFTPRTMKSGGSEDIRDASERRMDEHVLAAQKRRRRQNYLLVVAFLWVVVFWVLGYYGFQKWRARQARRLAASATEFADRGQLREAGLRARTAFEMQPEDLQVLRAMAVMLERLGDPQALAINEKIVASPAATARDRQRCVEAAIRFGRAAAAREEASQLEKSGDPGFLALVKANDLLQRGDMRGGEQTLRGIGRESAAFPGARLQLAGILAASGGESARGEAWEIYRSMSDGHDKAAAESMASALAAGVVPSEKVADWADLLQAHPAGNDRTYLIAQTAKLGADPSAKAQLVNAVMARFAGAPVERKSLAMHWLNEQQEFARTLEMVSERSARSDRNAFVLWLDALAGLQKWDTINGALEKTTEPLEGPLAELFRARATRMTGRTGSAALAYRRAVILALDNPRELAVTEFFLETDGQSAVWQQAMREALANPATKDAAVRGILGPATRSRDALRLREACKMMADNLPDDEAWQDALIYYDIVLGKPGLLDRASRRSAKRPDNFTRKANVALALLKDGREVEAVRVFDGLQVSSDRISPQEKAIVISVLAANRRFDQAQAMAMTLDTADLTLQEAQMLGGYLGTGTP